MDWAAQRLALLAGAALGALVAYPVRSINTRWAMVACAIAFWALAGWLLRTRRWAIVIWAAVLVVPAVVLTLPGRDPNPVAMQNAYVHALRGYIGVRYVWGGEAWWGVDCSGLARAAMVDALATQGVCTANPRLLRAAAWLWWNDAAARDFATRYAGRVNSPLPGTPQISTLHPAMLLPGDLAVTADGSHVLIHLGDRHWIEADPMAMHVRESLFAPGAPLPYDPRVQLLRWRLLSP